MDPDRLADPDGIRSLEGSSARASPPGDSLSGVRSLAEIEATNDPETRLIRLVSLLEVLVRDLVAEAGPERKSLNRMLETLAYSGGHPRRIGFRAVEYAINCRNALIHPNSGLRHAAPVDEREIRFSCEVLATAVGELIDRLSPDVGSRLRGKPAHADARDVSESAAGRSVHAAADTAGEPMCGHRHGPVRDRRLRVSDQPSRF